MTALRFIPLAFALLLPLAAPAQEQVLPRAGIVVLDGEALYQGSDFGRRVQADIDAASRQLQAENRSIEARLTNEERLLTEARGRMSVDEFRMLADNFDIRVDDIRRTQDVKQRALVRQAEAARTRFFEAANPVVQELANAAGALVVIERRTVIAAADAVDITQQVIAQVNARLGSGAGLAPAQQSAPNVSDGQGAAQ